MRTGGSTHRFGAALLIAAGLAALLAVALALATPSGAFASAPPAFSLDKPFVIRGPIPGDLPVAPRVTAKGAVVMDMETGTVLYSRDADEQLEMASTTKMMTAILILESMQLDEKVKVPAAATADVGSVLGLRRGETFTVEQLLYMMLLPSANDAAITLGIAQAGSIKDFVAKMNARAEEMGLTNTHFVNDCGLHAEDHYSSAHDLAEIASYAMHDPVFRRIVSTREYTVPHLRGVANVVIKTSNELLRDYDWVNGIKTGSTPYAGYCLVSSATKDGLTLISVVLGAKDEDTREIESKGLLEYGFERCGYKSLLDRGAVIADVPIADPLERQVRLVTASPFSRRLLGEGEVTGQAKLTRPVTLPVKAGEVLGELDFLQGDANLGSVPLVAADSMDVPTFRMIMDHWTGPWARALALTQLLASMKN